MLASAMDFDSRIMFCRVVISMTWGFVATIVATVLRALPLLCCMRSCPLPGRSVFVTFCGFGHGLKLRIHMSKI